MKYKFIDIGCSFFMVSTDELGINVNGIFVEPIKEYLDVLPSSDTIVKENVAIGSKIDTVKFNVFIPKNTKIRYYNTKELTRMMNKYIKEDPIHYIHKHPILGAILGAGGSTIYTRNDKTIVDNEFIEQKNIEVDMITLDELFKRNSVTEIDYFKVDVEGLEETIMLQLIQLMRKNKVKINKQIRFECNQLSDQKKLKNIAYDICSEFDFKYEYVHNVKWDEDIILTKL